MGVSQNLWGAVKLAKGLNPDEIPRNLTLGGVAIDENDIAGSFARHFSEKIRLGASKVKIEPNTHKKVNLINLTSHGSGDQWFESRSVRLYGTMAVIIH